MTLLLSSLLLASLRVRSSWSVSPPGTPVVTQSPDLPVTEGDTVNITCCWTGDFDRVRVGWLKNQTNIKMDIFFKNRSQGSLPKEATDCSKLTFADITREASGRYSCKVSIEIPVFIVVNGSGTVITVRTSNNPRHNTDSTDSTDSTDNTDSTDSTDSTDNTDSTDSTDSTAGASHREGVFIFLLRCLPILALVITFFCLNKFGAKAQQHTAAAPGSNLPSAQRTEDGREGEERDERVIETE